MESTSTPTFGSNPRFGIAVYKKTALSRPYFSTDRHSPHPVQMALLIGVYFLSCFANFLQKANSLLSFSFTFHSFDGSRKENFQKLRFLDEIIKLPEFSFTTSYIQNTQTSIYFSKHHRPVYRPSLQHSLNGYRGVV